MSIVISSVGRADVVASRESTRISVSVKDLPSEASGEIGGDVVKLQPAAVHGALGFSLPVASERALFNLFSTIAWHTRNLSSAESDCEKREEQSDLHCGGNLSLKTEN